MAVLCPEVTLCGWQDVKIQLLTTWRLCLCVSECVCGMENMKTNPKFEEGVGGKGRYELNNLFTIKKSQEICNRTAMPMIAQSAE